MPMREQSRIKADTVAKVCTCPGPAGTPHDAKCPSLQPDRAAKEAPAPAPKTCGSPVSGGRNCGDTTVATGSPITIVCGRCRTGRPPVDGARCRVCGHYETSIEHATEKYAHCPSCGRAPHWMPVKDDDPANNSKHSEREVHPTGTVAKILASEPIPAPAPEPSAPPAGVPVCKAWCGTERDEPGCLNYCTNECGIAGRPLNPPPSDPVTVATGGVPTGYRLGDGWQAVDPAFKWVCTSSTHDPLPGAVAWRHADIGHAVHYQYCCEPCAIEAGAIVPIDTARSVPPGPAICPDCPHELSRHLASGCCGTAGEHCKCRTPVPPATDASKTAADTSWEAAKRALSVPCPTCGWEAGHGCLELATAEPREPHPARLEAAKSLPPGDVIDETPSYCHPMCGKPANLPECDDDWWCSKACEGAGEPLNPPHYLQADAIKAAVDKERERCLAWWEWFWADTIGRNIQTETGIRSGEDAPGAVGK